MGKVAIEVVLVHHPGCLLAAGGAVVVEDKRLVRVDEDRVPYCAEEYPIFPTRRIPIAAPSHPVYAHPRQVLPIHGHKKKPLLLTNLHLFCKTNWP